VKKEGEEILQVLEQRFFPAAHEEDHGEAGCPPAVHRGPQTSKYPPAAHRRPHTGAGGCLEEAVTPRQACTGAASCQDVWTHGVRGTCAGGGLLAGFVTPWGHPRWISQFLKDCTPWEGLTLEQLVGSCLP